MIVLFLLIILCLYTFAQSVYVSDIVDGASDFPSGLTLIVIFFSLILSMVILSFSDTNKKSSNPRKEFFFSSISYLPLFSAIICSAILIIANVQFCIIEQQSSEMQPYGFAPAGNDPLVPIDLEQLEALDNSNWDGVVIVERESCYFCTEIMPEIERQFEEKGISAFHYNTEIDRDTRNEYFTNVIEKYEIYAVPIILVFEDGMVIKSFVGETLLEDFNFYLAEHRTLQRDHDV